jgi:hypothetical protein
MPRRRPGKRQRELKRAQDQQALQQLNSRIHGERNTAEKSNRVQKDTTERQFSTTEVNAIVQAAVTAAVTATVTATKDLVNGSTNTGNGSSSSTKSEKDCNTPKTLAERITNPPKRSLAERITFPERQ